jgi:hypothetical protein
MNKEQSMDPIFFLIRRTARQIRIHAADSFPSAETFLPLSPRHPQAHQAKYLIDAFAIAARGLPEHCLTAEELIKRVEPLIAPSEFARLKAMSKTQIVLRAA